MTGTNDPRLVATDAEKGSLLLRQTPSGDGQIFQKLDNGSTTNWELIPVSSGVGNADEIIETLKNQLNDSVYNLVTPNVFRTDKDTKVDNASTGAYDLTTDTFDLADSVGSNWIAHPDPNGNNWLAVTWSPELGIFVAVAGAGTTDRVITSSDGVNWTAHPVTSRVWVSVVWSPELGIFVATSSGAQYVMVSSDGINWSEYTMPSTGIWWSVTWSPELSKFIAVSSTPGLNDIMASTDGISWGSESTPTSRAWRSVIWVKELSLFVAVGSAATTDAVVTSPDGVTWTNQTTPDPTQWWSVAWSPELSLLVAVGYSGSTNQIMTSPDAVNWTTRTAPNNNLLSKVIWVKEAGIFVAVSEIGTNEALTSPDGINWTAHTPAENNAWVGLAWSPELRKLVSTSYSGTNKIMTSQGDNLISAQMLDSDEFLALGKSLNEAYLSVFWNKDKIDTTALYEVSRNGGTDWQTVTMDRVGQNSNAYKGKHEFADTETAASVFQNTIGVVTPTQMQDVIIKRAGEFTVASTSFLKEALIDVIKTGSPAGNVYVQILRDDGTGLPSSSAEDVLYISPDISITGLSAGTNNVSFSLNNLVLTPGTYHLAVVVDSAYQASYNGGTDYIQINLLSDVSYATKSAAYDKNTGLWTDGGNFGLSMDIQGNELDLRVKITTSSGDKSLDGYGIFYDPDIVTVVADIPSIQKFEFFAVADNLNEFTITNFLPDPEHLKVYYVQGGQVFRYGAFTVQGNTVIFPANTFNNNNVEATITLFFDQTVGGGFDNADTNAALLAANHLGSTDPTIDRSQAGRGIFLRRPDGTLRELVINDLDQVEIWSV